MNRDIQGIRTLVHVIMRNQSLLCVTVECQLQSCIANSHLASCRNLGKKQNITHSMPDRTCIAKPLLCFWLGIDQCSEWDRFTAGYTGKALQSQIVPTKGYHESRHACMAAPHGSGPSMLTYQSTVLFMCSLSKKPFKVAATCGEIVQNCTCGCEST